MAIDQPGTNRPTWAAEETHPEQCEKLRTKLGEVVDPEIGLNIIQLGLIRDVNFKEDQTIIKMILTTPFCPYGPAMLEMTRQKAEEALNQPAQIDLGLEAWDFSMMEEGLGGDWGLY
jgi:metal-sulfur cluster biosynthetic enzyme